MVEQSEFILIGILSILLGIALYYLFGYVNYSRKINKLKLAFGMNAPLNVGNNSIQLKCPGNMKIKANLAKLVCTNMNSSGFETSGCDFVSNGYNSDGSPSTDKYADFNIKNTVDVADQVTTQCAGKNSCTFTIDTTASSNNMCGGSKCNGNLQMIGTYYCEPN